MTEATLNPKFIHLNVHSEFSLIDGICRLKPLAKALKEKNMPAIAVCDVMNLFGLIKAYRTFRGEGIKPIVGADLRLKIQISQQKHMVAEVTCLCLNELGYRRLTELLSKAYIEAERDDVPLIPDNWLTEQSLEGCVVLSGGLLGDIAQLWLSKETELAESYLESWLKRLPGRFYLEVNRLGIANEEAYIQQAQIWSKSYGLPLIATQKVRFLKADDFEAHEARVCINQGRVLADSKRPKLATAKQYLTSEQEMQELFADMPYALQNTVELSKRCNVELTLGESYLPDFPTTDNLSIGDFLALESKKGLEERIKKLEQLSQLNGNPKDYYERLDIELKVINQMGFPGYFLIVADFIQWAKDNKIAVGPGRGSGAGSLVAYALKITDLDPLAYDLLFERFLNPERVSMPDFDVDFCMENRDKVINYVQDRYGRASVSQIITFGTMAAKAVVRDVGRVLGHPYGFVDGIAKMIPFELGMTLEKALQEEDFKNRYAEDDQVKELIDLALRLEGVARNAGRHAGGVVIAPSVLTDLTPIYTESIGGALVTQFDKDDVESIGLVKFDFLGLRTLTIIDWACQGLNSALENNNQDNNQLFDISTIPLDDAKTFELLQKHQTTAVFQLESRGMKDLIHRLQPDLFEDIIALVALFRPGPLQSGMVDDFIDRKHGRAEVVYPHPDLEPILSPTYGVILYQEQVMQIAQVLAGYTLGGADILRRAMGKKKFDEMAKQREIFVEGSKNRGVEEETAAYIFDLMEKFAGYGFNKSHSAAYALVSYQTAYLKTHYPSYFMAAVLSADMDNTDKLAILVDECKQMKLKVVAPSVNASEYKFKVDEKGDIQYGLGGIKGLGEGAIESIVNERKLEKYKSFKDFCCRVDAKKINRRALEVLIKSGALDELSVDSQKIRETLLAELEETVLYAEQFQKNKTMGQSDLFGLNIIEDDSNDSSLNDLPNIRPWTLKQRLQYEKDTLGFYFSGNPFDTWSAELKHSITAPLNRIRASPSPQSFAERKRQKKSTVIVAGIVSSIRFLKTKKGKDMAVFTIVDVNGKMDITLFSEQIEESRPYLKKDVCVVCSGEVSLDSFSNQPRMRAEKVVDVTQWRIERAKFLQLAVDGEAASTDFISSLKQVLEAYKNEECISVNVKVHIGENNMSVRLDDNWMVSPSDELFDELKSLADVKELVCVY